jgi:hypothetical protein
VSDSEAAQEVQFIMEQLARGVLLSRMQSPVTVPSRWEHAHPPACYGPQPERVKVSWEGARAFPSYSS